MPDLEAPLPRLLASSTNDERNMEEGGLPVALPGSRRGDIIDRLPVRCTVLLRLSAIANGGSIVTPVVLNSCGAAFNPRRELFGPRAAAGSIPDDMTSWRLGTSSRLLVDLSLLVPPPSWLWD